MKNTDPLRDDAPLDALLQEWQPNPSLPPRFQEQVWRRIERAETTPPPNPTFAQLCADWLTSKLRRPALAAAYVSVLLVIGASVGWSQARQERERVTAELGARYFQAVDPYRSSP